MPLTSTVTTVTQVTHFGEGVGAYKPHTGPRPQEKTMKQKRLTSADEYENAPPHTIIEFDEAPGKLGYKNWDHRWEVSTDAQPVDWDSSVMPDQDGAATVVRWGKTTP